jgi:uncharacterized membrane protein YfcA
MFNALVVVAALVAGGIASIAGFGIGSILTPLLAAKLGTKLAVAAVSIPHLLGTGLRLFLTRQHVNPRVLWTFGVTSAVGGLGGALLRVYFTSTVLGYLLGALLVFAGVTGLTGLASRIRFGRRSAWVAGGLSGAFGGLVGNQGGIRSAAMLAFDVPKEAFIATATAIGLGVDVARMPVYAATQWAQITQVWVLIITAAAGIIAGTLLGQPILRSIPEALFRRVVAVLILALGLSMLIHPGR